MGMTVCHAPSWRGAAEVSPPLSHKFLVQRPPLCRRSDHGGRQVRGDSTVHDSAWRHLCPRRAGPEQAISSPLDVVLYVRSDAGFLLFWHHDWSPFEVFFAALCYSRPRPSHNTKCVGKLSFQRGVSLLLQEGDVTFLTDHLVLHSNDEQLWMCGLQTWGFYPAWPRGF